jgi:hypothetical protein
VKLHSFDLESYIQLSQYAEQVFPLGGCSEHLESVGHSSLQEESPIKANPNRIRIVLVIVLLKISFGILFILVLLALYLCLKTIFLTARIALFITLFILRGIKPSFKSDIT